MWAAASPQSAVSTHTHGREGGVRGTKTDTQNPTVESCAPKQSFVQSLCYEIQSLPPKLLSYYIALLTEPTVHPNNPVNSIISHAINPQLVTVFMCALCVCFVHCCRELSYNQIEDLPSFYHCSALQEMWVVQPPTQLHTHMHQNQHSVSLHILHRMPICISQQRATA